MSEKLDKLKDKTFRGFIRANINADLTKLLFAGNKPHVDIKLAVDQILSRRKAKSKLPSWLENEGVIFPPPLSIEQASSEVTAHYKADLLDGKQFVDLTGGMGVDTLIISRHFEQATYVEQQEWLCEVFEENCSAFGISNIEIFHERSEAFLQSFAGKAAFYIDPARRDSHQQKVFRFEDCTPDITKILFLLKEKASSLLVKASPMIDITEGVRALKYVQKVHVISIKNECKEVLFEVLFTELNDNPEVVSINYASDGIESFSFSLRQERVNPTHFSKAKRYLFEPNTSILKGGGFTSICTVFPMEKLSQNTHLYTGDTLLEDFPGRKFIILKDGVSKEDIQVILSDKKANIITRNYPLKPDELKRKYKLKDGGNQYLIGYRDWEGKPQLAIANRV